MLVRQIPIGLGALAIGIALFTLMQALIRADGDLLKNDRDSAYLNFIRVKPNDRQAERKDRSLPEEPPPPEPPPKMPDVDLSQDTKLDTPSPQMAMAMPNIDVPMMGGDGPAIGAVGAGFGGSTGMSSDLVPLVRVPPNYPRKAKQAKLEGEVTLQLEINADGTVADAKIVEANPRRLFDEAAITAVMRWKFKPKVVDGVPTSQIGMQKIIFKLTSG